jgi:hypothetical protein
MGRLRAATLSIPCALACLAAAGCGRRQGAETTPDVDTASVSPAEMGSYLYVVAPSVVERGADVPLRLRVLTNAGIPDYDIGQDLRLRVETSGPAKFPASGFRFEPTPEGSFEGTGIALETTGVQRIRTTVPDDTLAAIANAVNVVESAEWRVFWGDLNGHSDLSSGPRTPAVYWWYAKSVGLLDFAALTDNDEAGEKVLDDASFFRAADVMQEFDLPGRFVPLLAFEWSAPEHGHRVVLFSERPESLPAVASGADTPAKLRAAVGPDAILMLAHPSGSAGDPPTKPEDAGAGREQLVEIYSSLGIFERAGTHRPSTRERSGAFVADLLARGFRPGFTASSDTRLTTPGNPRTPLHGNQAHPGGLTAVLAKELTRAAVLDALRERRCYATSGPRFLLEFSVNGRVMGSDVHVPKGTTAEAYGSLGSITSWTRVEIVGPSGPIGVLTPPADDADVVELTATTAPVDAPTWLYLRGVDENGDMAWSSPVYLSPE